MPGIEALSPLGIVDGLIFVFLAVLIPLGTARSYPRIRQRLLDGEPGLHEALYQSGILTQWVLVSLLLLYWWFQGRGLAELGLIWRQPWEIAGFVLALMAVHLFFVLWLVLVSCSHIEGLNRWWPRLRHAPGHELVPISASQLRLWAGVSMTAGICEEILFRGFILWCLNHWFYPGASLLIMAIIFGLGHIYQGRRGMVQTGVVGLILGLIYVASGSLLLAMLWHTLIDWAHGWAWFRLRRLSEAEESRKPL